MSAPLDTNLRALVLGFEVRDSIKLIERGLGELQLIDMSNDFYLPAFLFLSGGLERLMKCIICLLQFEQNGTFPSKGELQRRGHDLEALLAEVADTCFAKLDGRTAIEADAIYLRSDEDMRDTVRILSRFGASARYYNLDVAAGADPSVESPADEWARMESEIVAARPELVEDLANPTAPIYDKVNPELVGRIERVARALCRLFTLGPLGKRGGEMLPYIGSFLYLLDEEIGQRDYRC